MTRPTDKDTVHIKEKIKAASNDLNAMDSVADVSTVDLTKMNTNQRYKWAVSFLKTTGYKIDRQNFGVIEFSEKQINTGMNYLNDPGEFAAFAALPRVLKRGKIIHDDNNHKFRKYGTVIIAAPVTINGVRGNMGVAIQKTTSTHYHTHRILMPDGSAFEFKINAEPTPSGDLANNAHRATTISTASNDKVSQPKPGVNPKSVEAMNADDMRELTGMLTDFYSFIANDEELAWESVMEKAAPIADFIQSRVNVKPQMSDMPSGCVHAHK